MSGYTFKPIRPPDPDASKDSTKDPPRPTVAQFADDTTIHGIKDLYRVWSENGVLKWAWVLLLLASTGSMVYEMVQVLLNYLARPTATQIAQMYLDSYRYPLMLFCPRFWINATRVKALAIPKPVLAYALSFMHLIKVDPIPPIVDFKSTETQLQQLMEKYRFDSYFDLYLNISYDSDRILSCPSCAVWPSRKRVTEDGVCYEIELKPAKVSFIIEHPPQITYDPVYPSKLDAENWLPPYNSSRPTENLYVGYYPNDFFGTDPIKLAHNKSYVIKVTPTLQRRFSGVQLKTGRGCYDSEAMAEMNHSQRMCYSDCEEWTYGPTCWNAQYIGYSYDRPGSKRAPWYSSLTYSDIEPPKAEMEACQKREKPNYDTCAAKCLPACEEWIYDTTVVAVNSRRMWMDHEEAAVTIVISYQVKAGTLAVEEVSTYTYHTFLSNIGGQLGLWYVCPWVLRKVTRNINARLSYRLGASVLSVCQLVFFLVRLAYDRWNDEHRHAATRPNGVAQNGHPWSAHL